MEKLIWNMWNAPRLICRQGYGVFTETAEVILQTFRAVQNTYQKANRVKVHYMELYVEKDKEAEAVVKLADCMGRYFFQMGFQAFVTITDEGGFYLAAIAVHAVSYDGTRVFHDNNNNYRNVYQYLCQIAPGDWKVTVSESTFFDPRVGEGNYVHGIFA